MTAIQDIPLKRIDGSPATLADFKGQVLLLVNVASKCGLTPQYEGLEKLYEGRRAKGLAVLGFPANDFGAQEPGTEAEIQSFCTTNYGVQFPMFSKISVKGADQHPLYAALVEQKPQATSKPGTDFRKKLESYGIRMEKDTDVMWNFEKFVIGRDGRVAGRFTPDTAPDDPLLTDCIDAELAKG